MPRIEIRERNKPYTCDHAYARGSELWFLLPLKMQSGKQPKHASTDYKQ